MIIINNLVDYLTKMLSNGGVLYGFLIVILESIIPALPLSVFIALNQQAFGFLWGVLISWLATCIGCYLSYLLFFSLSNNFIYKHLGEKKKKIVKKATTKFQKIPFCNLVVIIALPFTPAFLINIVSGMASLSKKKYLCALLTGKIFMVFFWAYVGKSLIESITDIKTIMMVSFMLVIAYFLSKFISKKANIE